MFIGGTALLTETYRPEEKAKAQGSNDFVVFAVQGVSSLSSGLLISRQGWDALNAFALPALAVTAAATLLFARWQRASARRAVDLA